jgi:hypothetical protein
VSSNWGRAWGKAFGVCAVVGAGLVIAACQPEQQAANSVQQPTLQPLNASTSEQPTTTTKRPSTGASTSTKAVTSAKSTTESQVMVRTYTPGGEQVETAKKPEVFIPGSVSGAGPAEVEVLVGGWDEWSNSQAIGHGSVRVTGGGGAPEVYDNITITLKNVAMGHDGTRYFTVFGLAGPGYPAEERAIQIDS